MNQKRFGYFNSKTISIGILVVGAIFLIVFLFIYNNSKVTIKLAHDRPAGSISGWGDDRYNQISGIPEGNNFVAVDAGTYHSIALRRKSANPVYTPRQGSWPKKHGGLKNLLQQVPKTLTLASQVPYCPWPAVEFM